MSTGPTFKSSDEIRREFLSFFEEKGHTVVPSASIVPFGDSTLLFTNAGMNQFKDVFLGTGQRSYVRAADTQKCLRVSGKHNDLEEVGHDTYHHTFFEMLGNWSFGDYFKEEAITWAWELLVDRWGLDPNRLYATVHEGDEKKGVTADTEAEQIWADQTSIPNDHILHCSSKDNFWMMGATGPCGPCTEIHIDLRPDDERATKPGIELVNQDDPRVIEIWNLVFIQYNALSEDELQPLAAKHVDTGMGFERITAVLQGKDSTYDSDLFAPILQKIADLCPDERVKGYDDISIEDNEEREKIRIAMRVIADHVRTIAIAIGDAVTPGPNGRGYVIRRILRRAVRYGYQFLGLEEPFLCQLMDALRDKMGDFFTELDKYQKSIFRITQAEEESFLRTLVDGLKDFNRLTPHIQRLASGEDTEAATQQLREEGGLVSFLRKAYQQKDTEQSDDDMIAAFVEVSSKGLFSGDVTFLLHDTYGFPKDLTALMARENGLHLDEARYQLRMNEQKELAKSNQKFVAMTGEDDSWEDVRQGDDSAFVGYDATSVNDARIQGWRSVKSKDGKEQFHLLLDHTPFYAESGGQVGDTGVLQIGDERINVLDTQKENGKIIHIVETCPAALDAPVTAEVDADRRLRIAKHHTATHLLHAALREVLGPHVNQQGSLVAPDRLRFDFSHFERISRAELIDIEQRVNEVIQYNVTKQEDRDIAIEEALGLGARALFGEKYGEHVRVITFDPAYSIELCGGIHCDATGQIGMFRFLSESAVAAGSRRVEAVVGQDALQYVQQELASLAHIRGSVRTAERTIEEEVAALVEHAKQLEKEMALMKQANLLRDVQSFVEQATDIGPARLVTGRIDGVDSGTLRDVIQNLRDKLNERTVVVLGSAVPEDSKVYLATIVSDDLIKEHKLKAGAIVGQIAKIVGGGGGGKPTLATAGGRQPEKLDEALQHAHTILQNALQA